MNWRIDLDIAWSIEKDLSLIVEVSRTDVTELSYQVTNSGE